MRSVKERGIATSILMMPFVGLDGAWLDHTMEDVIVCLADVVIMKEREGLVEVFSFGGGSRKNCVEAESEPLEKDTSYDTAVQERVVMCAME